MGIITRLYHRSDGLADNKFNVFFMDMGENIHIHYRDLRIELGVDEFLEFAELCNVYLPQVKGEIDKGYRDGVRPNTNEAATWTQFYNKKPLANTIVYNPNRISLEENVDGYHVHIRNYKILLDKPSFLSFAKAAKDVLEKQERPVDLQETLGLIEANELEHYVNEVGHDDGHETAVVTVEKAFYKKTVDLLQALKYTNIDSSTEATVFEKDGARLYLRIGTVPKAAVSGAVGSPMVPFADFVHRNATHFTPADFNRLKLQVLDFFGHVRNNKLESVVELDYRNLIYDTEREKVIFPTKERPEPSDIEQEYNRMMTFFREQGLSFVKPAKVPYTDVEHHALTTAFYDHVRRHISPHLCVKRIYLLNAGAKKRSGRYEVPFVHFDWAKLGSDFDLLIEIDERHPLPPEWDYKFFWKDSSSDYYLLGDVAYPVASPYPEQYPNITFYNHLIEAYLFFPSKGDVQVMSEYVKKFGAARIYERTKPQEEMTVLAKGFVAESYGFEVAEVEKLGGPSFNEVLSVTTADARYAAKIMKKEDFTRAVEGQSGRHIEYEASLLQALSGKDLPVLVPVAGKDGNLVQPIDDRFCMLFPFIDSDKEPGSEGTLEAAAHALAKLHGGTAGSEVATDLYRFNEALDYWIEQYATLHEKFGRDEDLHARFAALLPRLEAVRGRALETDGVTWTHLHGDVCPRNFFYVGDGAILYDFQAAHHGPRLADLAEGAMEFAWQGAAIDPALVDGFVSAYEEEGALNEAERALLPTMLFVQAALKLARSFRVEVLFGYKVSRDRVAAFIDYAEKALEALD